VLYKRAMRERIPVSLEHSHVWEDGRVSWLDMRAYPVGGDQLAIFYRDVTERHETEQKLRESEARFRCAIEGFDDVLWTNSADGRMRGEQPGWSGLTGQTIEEYQDFGWLASVHPDDAQPTINAWNVAVAERRVFDFQHRVRRHDGEWRRCKIRAVPIIDDDRSVREWVGVHSDITDLMESETRFRQLSENIDVVFYVHEIDEGRVSYVSPAYERFWQQPAQAVYDDFLIFLDPIHPEDRSAVEQALATRSTGENTEVRYRLVKEDGTTRYIHDRGFVTTHPDSGARRAVGIAEDVTITTQARLQLSRNAATFESLITNNPFGIYVVDEKFALRQISLGSHKVFADIEPLIGRDFSDIIKIVWAEPYATEIIKQFRHTLATGEAYVSGASIKQRHNLDQSEAYDWRIERIELPHGEYGVVCYFYDLSERLALEADLQQALSDKDVLLHEIDHRIRNSLSMVSSLLSMQGSSSNSAEIKQALAVAAMRLQAVARIHERLYKGRVVGTVEFDIYLEEICRDLEASLGHDKTSLTLQTVP
jgi:PAS domain S-box-containing protein